MKCQLLCVEDGSLVRKEIDLERVIDLELEAGLGQRISISISPKKIGFDIRTPEGDMEILPRAVNAIRLGVRRYGKR